MAVCLCRSLWTMAALSKWGQKSILRVATEDSHLSDETCSSVGQRQKKRSVHCWLPSIVWTLFSWHSTCLSLWHPVTPGSLILFSAFPMHSGDSQHSQGSVFQRQICGWGHPMRYKDKACSFSIAGCFSSQQLSTCCPLCYMNNTSALSNV